MESRHRLDAWQMMLVLSIDFDFCIFHPLLVEAAPGFTSQYPARRNVPAGAHRGRGTAIFPVSGLKTSRKKVEVIER